MSPINMSVIRRHQNLQARRSKLKSAGPLMQRTIKKYERDAARIRTRLGSMPKDQPLRKRLMIAFTENASRPSYARQLRAAMRYSIIVRLDENILKAWAAIEAGDALTAIRALEKGEHGCSWAETIERMIAEDDWNLPNPKPRRSKAAVLAQLPAGWRETLLGHLKGKEHRFWQAVGVMACSGCRPEEVRLQVEIKTLDAGAVCFTISSAKAGKQRRRQIFILEGDHFFDLAMALARTNQTVGLGGSEDKLPARLGDSVSRICKKLFPKTKENISPYCLRHQLSADLKASGFSPEHIAMALGHTNINTQFSYGKTRHGKGGRRIIIQTEILVRGVLKAHRFATPAALEVRPELCQAPPDNDPPPGSSSPGDDEPPF